MDRRCTKCKEMKPISEFNARNKAKGTYASNCKSCQKIAKDKHYQQNKDAYKQKAKRYDAEYKQWWMDFKATLSCNRCPENHPATLDFHHPDGTKDSGVGELVWKQKSKAKVMAEVAKCEVLCSNCHRKHHWNERHNPRVDHLSQDP